MIELGEEYLFTGTSSRSLGTVTIVSTSVEQNGGECSVLGQVTSLTYDAVDIRIGELYFITPRGSFRSVGKHGAEAHYMSFGLERVSEFRKAD